MTNTTVDEARSLKIGVSVVLPVHDEAPFLEQALSSTLSQRLDRPLEVIVVLDRPKDSVLSTLSGFTSPHLRLLKSEQPGGAAARNLGIDNAQYQYIALMDADDVSLPGRLHEQAQFLDTHLNIVAVGGQVHHIDHEGNVIARPRLPEDPGAIRRGMRHGSCICNPSAMVRLSALSSVGKYKTHLVIGEDYDMWLRLIEMGDLCNLPTTVLLYRIHPQQSTHGLTLRTFSAPLKIRAENPHIYRLAEAATGRKTLHPLRSRIRQNVDQTQLRVLLLLDLLTVEGTVFRRVSLIGLYFVLHPIHSAQVIGRKLKRAIKSYRAKKLAR